MKLDLNCIRDILLYLENALTVSMQDDLAERPISFDPISIYDMENDIDYSLPEICNTVCALEEAGFLMCITDRDGMGKILLLDIYRLTYDGYQFLETIRPNSVWDKVSSIYADIGAAPIDSITKTTSSIITELAKSLFLTM